MDKRERNLTATGQSTLILGPYILCRVGFHSMALELMAHACGLG